MTLKRPGSPVEPKSPKHPREDFGLGLDEDILRVVQEHTRRWNAEADERIREATQAYVKEISDLRSKNEQLQCNIQAVSEGKEALIADSHNLNNQVKSLDTRNGALQEENTKLSERNESLLKEIVGLRNKVRELEHDWKQATDDLEGAAAAEAKFADLHAQMGAALRVMSSKRSNIRVSSSPPDNLERHPSPLDPTNSHTLAKLKTSPPPAPSQAVTRSSLPQRPLLSNSGDMSDPSYQRVSIKGSPIAHSRHRSPPPSRRENLEPGEIERRRSWFARR